VAIDEVPGASAAREPAAEPAVGPAEGPAADPAVDPVVDRAVDPAVDGSCATDLESEEAAPGDPGAAAAGNDRESGAAGAATAWDAAWQPAAAAGGA
jgi:hypothetical protein